MLIGEAARTGLTVTQIVGQGLEMRRHVALGDFVVKRAKDGARAVFPGDKI